MNQSQNLLYKGPCRHWVFIYVVVMGDQTLLYRFVMCKSLCVDFLCNSWLTNHSAERQCEKRATILMFILIQQYRLNHPTVIHSKSGQWLLPAKEEFFSQSIFIGLVFLSCFIVKVSGYNSGHCEEFLLNWEVPNHIIDYLFLFRVYPKQSWDHLITVIDWLFLSTLWLNKK